MRSLPSTTATAPRKKRILSFMGARKKFLFASVLCSGLVSVLVACHGDRPESFYASLADARKAEASAQSWIPDDLLPASSRTIHVVGELSPSKEWCAFKFLPADSQNLLKNLKSLDALPPPVKYVRSPRVSWWPSVLEGNLDVEKIHTMRASSYLSSKDPRTLSLWAFTSLRSTCRRGADSSTGLTSPEMSGNRTSNPFWADPLLL